METMCSSGIKTFSCKIVSIYLCAFSELERLTGLPFFTILINIVTTYYGAI